MGTKTNRVAILDAGGQYVDLVVKAVERLGYPATLLPIDTPATDLVGIYGAIIMSGSPASSHAESAPTPDPALWKADINYLGICYGMQALVSALGGTVERGLKREDGRTQTVVDTAHRLFQHLKKDQTALFTHGDFITGLPDDITPIGGHELAGKHVYSAVAHGNFVGVQFHPEVFEDTPEGYQIFRNFLGDIAGLKPDKKLLAARVKRLIKAKRAKVIKQVDGRNVIAFVSGGVDSTVALTLAATEIPPEKLHAYYIDSGFMRYEDDDVIAMLTGIGINVKIIHAAEQFANAKTVIDGIVHGPLAMTIDPQTKRRLIGKTFIDIQNDLIKELKLTEPLLLQGTNAADRIESGYSTGGNTAVIKTHHNQVKEVKELEAKGLLLEPLSDLHKNEIREIGHHLGLPYDVVERQPFPGPGLAIRIICNKKAKKVAPHKLDKEVNKLITDRSTLTAHILPVRSVGVGGDERSHLSAVALHSQEATVDWPLLKHLATEIPAHYRGQINRVVYALGSQKLTPVYTEPTYLASNPILQLRHADAIVFAAMRKEKLLTTIKQFPVVLLPVAFGGPGSRSIVLRPITTVTYLVSQAMLPEIDLPKNFLKDIANQILTEVDGISQVFLDMTNKPPATTEWE
jgi:GMP synthase (glutamine-hydrolysing)